MVSDDEKREVAERLRELPDDSTYPDLIGAIADHDGWYAAADAADRLADLIGPPRQCPYYDSGRHWCSIHDAPTIDREALLALADELEGEGLAGWTSGPVNVGEYARRIREALGEVTE